MSSQKIYATLVHERKPAIVPDCEILSELDSMFALVFHHETSMSQNHYTQMTSTE